MAQRVPQGRVARGRKLGMLAAGHAAREAGTKLSMVGRSERAKALLSQRSTIETAEQVVEVLGSLKGAAMKLGQTLSMLDLGLVPESHRERFREKLAVLRDQAPATSFATMRATLDEDYGSMTRVFRDFDEAAIASASIGQVYRATLRDGRDVAVKIQYPGIDAAVRSDLRNLALVAKMWKSMWPALSGGLLIEEITRNLESELDYVREAATQHEVAQRYRGHPFIVVPDAIVAYCTPRVLVTEYFPSQPFAAMRGLPDPQRNRIGELIYRFYVGSLFQRNEFCGDPHPGNVLLGPDGRIGFVDFGLYNRMNPGDVAFERELLKAAAESRGDDLLAMMVGRGIVDAGAGVTADECLEYVRSASEWNLLDEPVTVTPELASGALLLAIDPRATQFAGMRHQQLPPEHVFSRRADFLTFGMLGQLGATMNWHRIAREWIYGEPPATEVGRAIEAWRLCS